MSETKPIRLTGADLAGSCEGEQIADMITLLQLIARGHGRDPMYAVQVATKAALLLDEIEARMKAGR